MLHTIVCQTGLIGSCSPSLHSAGPRFRIWWPYQTTNNYKSKYFPVYRSIPELPDEAGFEQDRVPAVWVAD